jgi:putative hydrolase of the HAD superfamily
MKTHERKSCEYKHIFIDLDRTIWDFERNARETFMEIYHKHQLFEHFGGFDEFYDHYKEYNDTLWKLYREGEVKKDDLSWKRFLLTLKEGGVDDEKLAKTMSEEYLTISPTKRKLFSYAQMSLIYLGKQYKMHLITNGFKEVQLKKIENAKLGKYFDSIFTSEEIGAQKPKKAFFDGVLKRTGAKKKESLVIGDDMIVDIIGAQNAGIDQVWFNPNRIDPIDIEEDIPEGVPTIEIHNLRELIHIL